MSISAGTYTFGTGGTYATFKALWDDWTGVLAGNVIFLQVGDSDNTGQTISGTKSCGGFSVTIRGNTPHYGSQQNGHVLKAGRMIIGLTPTPAFLLDDVYINVIGGPSGLFDGFGYGASSDESPDGTAYVRAKNCIFVGVDNACSLATHNLSTSAKFSTIQVSGCKFVANKWCLNVSDGATSNPDKARFAVYIENNAFYVKGTASSAFANGRAIGLWEASSFWPMAVQHVVNNTFYLSNVTVQSAFAGPGSNGVGNATTVLFTKNAVNGSAADVATWPSAFYNTTMAVPSDLQSITSTDFGFLNTNTGSALYTAGATPQLAINPYTTAPYPIGVWYAPPGIPSPAILTNQAFTLTQISVTAHGNGDSTVTAQALTLTQKAAEAINLATPVLLAPAIGSRDRLASPILSWTDVPNAELYEVSISYDLNFSPRLKKYIAYDSQIHVGVPFSSLVYWKVRAVGHGGYSQFSETWSFSTGVLIPEKITNHDREGRSRLLWQFQENAGA